MISGSLLPRLIRKRIWNVAVLVARRPFFFRLGPYSFWCSSIVFLLGIFVLALFPDRVVFRMGNPGSIGILCYMPDPLAGGIRSESWHLVCRHGR